MASMDDREKGFERKFAFDEELRFKATARRNKLFGLWVAEKLGKSGADAEAYAKAVVIADLAEAGDQDIIRKVQKDLDGAGISLSDGELKLRLIDLMAEALRQIETSRA
ncbi:MAG: hypothetical protein BGN87_16440 [Rhizobiales bacterium 65-79]|jgi:hypothetical protein|nr:DUF1476 domain-containing protein [Hyphomicrobiales bacterium]OJU06573.1 MAG: hypothetical protein BGN87_16440 [Rhizobiales bacterium 65-79]